MIKEKLARDGKFTSKKGRVRRRLSRPGAEPDKVELARQELAKGIGIGKVAREVGHCVGTVPRAQTGNGGHMTPINEEPQQIATLSARTAKSDRARWAMPRSCR